MFDIRDFVSLACLTNTPFPNNFAVAALGIDKSEMSPEAVVLDIFECSRYNVVVNRMRYFVAWGLGDLDKDLGLFIQKQMWNWWHKYGNFDKLHDVDSGLVEKMRMDIYGPNEHCGRDYNGYQPCRPPKFEPITTLDEFKKEFEKMSYKTVKNWPHKFANARIRLADMWEKRGKADEDRWLMVADAFARDLNTPLALMVAGLKGEF